MFMKKIIRLLCLLASSLLFLTATVQAIEVNDKAPSCLLSTLKDGQAYDLQNVQGKIIYVDFWASWCPPCAKAFPFLNSMHQDFKNNDLQIIAINLDEEITAAQTFLDKYPANFTLLADPTRQCAKAFDVQAMPSSYLIDRKGNIRYVHLGFRSGEASQIRQRVKQLLAENTSSKP